MRNYGQHNALLCGIRTARYDIIATMDDPKQALHWIEGDGSTWLAFKARAKQTADPFYTGMTIGVARAPHFTGPYTVVGDEPR